MNPDAIIIDLRPLLATTPRPHVPVPPIKRVAQPEPQPLSEETRTRLMLVAVVKTPGNG